MSSRISAGYRFVPEIELWVGEVSSRYGIIEIVINGDSSAPAERDLAAVEAYMAHTRENIERLRSRLPISFLWRPIRLAPNEGGKMAVQFRQALFGRLEMLFDDCAAQQMTREG
jgi:hypothetical protein